MKKTYTNRQKLQRLTTAGILVALSIVLMLTTRFSIFPQASFYVMEFADVPILLCSSILGPVYSLISLFVVCLIQATAINSDTHIIGFIMHFLSSGLMILIVYFIRKKLSGIKGVLISNISGVIVMTLIMIPLNVLMVGVLYKMPAGSFFDAYLWYCIGFNLIKASANLSIYSIIAPKLIKEYNKLFNRS